MRPSNSAALAAVAIALPARVAAAQTLGHGFDVTNGAADSKDDGVVALLDEDQVVCTGVVVAPQVVLTAAHCLYTESPAALPSIVVGQNPAASAARFTATRQWLHPLFDPVSHANDVALLLASQPLPATVMRLLESPLANLVGATVDVVGYGLNAADSGAALSRRYGTAAVSAADLTTVTLQGAPSLPCNGDSGGPVLLHVDGATAILGVVSYGDPSCASFAVAMRVDAYDADFLGPYSSAGAVAAGGPCFFDGNCSRGGSCIAPPDAPRMTYCASPCASPSDCTAPFECSTAGTSATASCLYPAPSPGAMGRACTGALDCDSVVCAHPAGSDQSTCTVACFPDDSQPCPSDDDCLANPDVAGAYACFPAAGATGGQGSRASCAVRDGGRRDDDAVAGLFVMAVWCAGKRRRSVRRLDHRK